AEPRERMRRSVVERRHVDTERVEGEHVKATESIEGDQGEAERCDHGQPEGEPRAPAASPDTRFLTRKADDRRVARPVDTEAHAQRQGWAPLAARVGRAGDGPRALVPRAPQR